MSEREKEVTLAVNISPLVLRSIFDTELPGCWLVVVGTSRGGIFTSNEIK